MSSKQHKIQELLKIRRRLEENLKKAEAKNFRDRFYDICLAIGTVDERLTELGVKRNIPTSLR